jgi:hypothetical protein
MKPTYDISNNCGKKRGCTVVIILPYGSRPRSILSGMYGTRYDIPKVLPLFNLSLDTQPTQKKPLEKMAA